MNGVSQYIHGEVTLRVNFPAKRVQCRYCLLCKYEHAYDRYRCLATDEWLLEPTKTRGWQCPIIFYDEETE